MLLQILLMDYKSVKYIILIDTYTTTSEISAIWLA